MSGGLAEEVAERKLASEEFREQTQPQVLQTSV